MTVAKSDLLNSVATELQLSQDDLITQGLRALLLQRLQEIKGDIFELHGRYGVNSVEEMEERYETGTIEEADSWRDLQRLDHLEYKRDRLMQFLEQLQ